MKPEESHKLIHYAKTAVISLALSFFVIAPVLANNAPVPQDNHAYTLTKVNHAGENTITKYEWSNTENKYVPVYYRVDLNKTEYGHTDKYDEVKEFTVTTPNSDGTGNAFKYDIKYYVDNSRKAPDRITSSQQGADINYDFIEKYTVYSAPAGSGGAISNTTGTIGNITGDFIGNYVEVSPWGDHLGGAIYNSGKINTISGNFIGNRLYRDNNSGNPLAMGGAIYNSGTINKISGDFIGNYVQIENSRVDGGTIYNIGKITDISANFIANYIVSGDGGAIYNEKTIENITGDFIANYSGFGSGGAIYNEKTIENITGDFVTNYAGRGGAIYNEGTIQNIKGNFIGNYVQDYRSAGAIYNDYNSSINNITANFIGNYAQAKSDKVQGGAIYNYGTIDEITNSVFINNYAKSEKGIARGGAIYTNKDLNIVANNGGQSVFSGNFTESNGVKTPNAIYLDPNVSGLKTNTTIDSLEGDKVTITTETTGSNPTPLTLTLNANTNGIIQFDKRYIRYCNKIWNYDYIRFAKTPIAWSWS